MVQVRIDGHTIEVAKKVSGQGAFYTISGPGMSGFRDMLVRIDAKPGEPVQGAFIVNEDNLKAAHTGLATIQMIIGRLNGAAPSIG